MNPCSIGVNLLLKVKDPGLQRLNKCCDDPTMFSPLPNDLTMFLPLPKL